MIRVLSFRVGSNRRVSDSIAPVQEALPSLPLLRRRFGHRLARLATHWRREIDHDLRRFNLTDATWRPLYYLGTLEPPVRQTDLARALSVEAQSLVRVLDVLEQRGLVTREVDPDDRRSKLVVLTQEGAAMGKAVLAVADDVAARVLSDVSERELVLCLDVFERVGAALNAERDDEKVSGSVSSSLRAKKSA
ncbi:MarR family transcriptional regulator [Acetobacter estunensis]|nr:MarR family transcriptional regulator [Acetobacter estunensis]